MAISPTLGASASLASAATTLAFAANTLTLGQYIVVCISIPGTQTVSSISDGSANVYTKQSAITNGTSVRSEIWTCPITAATASRTITITFGGSTLASACFEEYAGPTAIGNIGTPSTGTGNYAGSPVATQDDGSYSVTAAAAATLTGSIFSTWIGTIRQSVNPALTSASTALVDSTSRYAATSDDGVLISSSVAWAAVSLELRTGVSPLTITANKANVIVSPKNPASAQTTKTTYLITGSTPIPVAQVLQNGTVGIAYSETISAQGGVSPYTFSVTTGALPSGTSLNGTTGVISGTPTTAGTYNFTVKVTDANGSTGTQAFQIIIANPSVGAGGSFTYAG